MRAKYREWKRQIDAARTLQDRDIAKKARTCERTRTMFWLLRQGKSRDAARLVERSKRILDIDLTPELEVWCLDTLFREAVRAPTESPELAGREPDPNESAECLRRKLITRRADELANAEFADRVRRELWRRVELRHKERAWKLVAQLQASGIDFAPELVRIFSTVIPRRPLT